MTKLIVKIASFCAHLGTRFYYGPWSRLYRWLYEKQYTKLPIDLPWTPHQVEDFFGGCKWVADGWKELGDAISSPEKFYSTKSGDCDDWSAFAGAVMAKPNWLCSVEWYDPKAGHFWQRFTGHNICVYPAPNGEWCHISNFGILGPFVSIEQVVESVIPDGCILLNYAFRTADRRLKWLGKTPK